jgi:Kef-type K+ transport system membrane component KefB
LFCEAVHLGSKVIDSSVPIHLEVLLPAFVAGCLLARPKGQDPHAHDDLEGHEPGPEDPVEQRVATIVSAAFMVLVGQSMPPIWQPADAVVHDVPRLTYEGALPEALAEKATFPGWGTIGLHVLAITVLSNLGKMFPAACYRREATLRERLAVAVCMFPRGEVGAGVLVVSLSYGIGGPALTVAVLSLAVNLLCSGFFIWAVKRLLTGVPREAT